jgi:hypothetical protein
VAGHPHMHIFPRCRHRNRVPVHGYYLLTHPPCIEWKRVNPLCHFACVRHHKSFKTRKRVPTTPPRVPGPGEYAAELGSR